MKLKIAKGDTVEVISGKDKGRKGAVLSLDKTRLKIKVQGVFMQTHFSREDGVKTHEGFVDYSNVKLIEKKTKKATKAKKKTAAKA
ncbi:MAG: KOW motif-containing protein [Bdellovibrionales bacterium]|nr:KOW motif-containing protein [Bdellovibrionales bacterium]